MQTITGEEVIARPVETVWAYVADPRRERDWFAAAVGRELLNDEPLGKGSRFRRVDRFLGKTVDTTFEVTEYDPPNRIGNTVMSGEVSGTDEVLLEAVEGGTRVAFKAETVGFGGLFGKLADPVAARMITRVLRSSLANLKELVEAES